MVMDHLEVLNKIKIIESKYIVEDVKFQGVRAWPYLRIYLHDSMLDKPTRIKIKLSSIWTVIKGLLSYNPFVIFGHFRIWLFNATERRKKIGKKYVQRVSGAVHKVEASTLTIEKNGLFNDYYSKQFIDEDKIIGEVWLLILTHIIEFFLPQKGIIIEHEEILSSIKRECAISFDYKAMLKHLYAQKLAMKFFLGICHTPEIVIMECPYVSMGYVWAIKEKGIRIIELQHGVINESHNAYNVKWYSPEFYPDEICVYGSLERDFFNNRSNIYCKIVHETGLYILEEIERKCNKDVFAEYRNKYDTIVVVSGQTDWDKEILSFIKNVASKQRKILFAYVPRHPISIQNNEESIIINNNVNIYELLKWCDIHSTVSSTTCLECTYYSKPTIFINIHNESKIYYSQVLNEKNGAYYASDPDDFLSAMESLRKHKFVSPNFFSQNHMEKLKSIL